MNLMKLSPKLKIIIAGVLIVLFFLALNLTPAKKEIKNFFYLISSPIQKVFWRAGERVSDFLETISEIKNLKKENEEIKLKNQELIAQIALLKELEKENEILREALAIGLEKEFKLLLAEVISKDISQDFILINKGSKEGIAEGLPVITQQKVLLGKIKEVYENFSKVMPISNNQSSFSAKIPEREIQGLVKGKGNFKVLLDLIPRDKEIFPGDIVVSSVLGGIYPPGLLVGQIKEVKKSDIEPFQKAEIKPAFDIKEIETLFIILEY